MLCNVQTIYMAMICSEATTSKRLTYEARDAVFRRLVEAEDSGDLVMIGSGVS